MGLMIAFMVAQGLYLSRHALPDETDSQPPPR